MNLPDMMKAKVRGKADVKVIYDDYNITGISEIGKDKKYLILTYGCQMNVHDSENMAGIMEDMGFTRTEEMEEADVIIVNTCAIRENAHNKAEGMLGRIKHLKETKEDIVVIFCGCMAQEYELVNKIKDYPSAYRGVRHAEKFSREKCDSDQRYPSGSGDPRADADPDR